MSCTGIRRVAVVSTSHVAQTPLSSFGLQIHH